MGQEPAQSRAIASLPGPRRRQSEKYGEGEGRGAAEEELAQEDVDGRRRRRGRRQREAPPHRCNEATFKIRIFNITSISVDFNRPVHSLGP